MKVKHIAAAVAVACVGLSAHATATDWGAHEPFEFGFGFAVGPLAALTDTFSFTLGIVSDITYTAVTNDAGLLDLTGSTLGLYSGVVGSSSFVAGFAFDNVQVQDTTFNLPAGAYYYQISSSVAPGAVAGSYTITSQVSPIPEPQTYALMLAGLLAMSAMISRRRRDSR